MAISVGIDLGTFHSVATCMQDNAVHIPAKSIRSIALQPNKNSDAVIVGKQAMLQLNSSNFEMILAPKLELKRDNYRKSLIEIIIKKLAEQTLDDLNECAVIQNSSNVVVTVPPEWNLSDCKILKEAVEEIGGGIRVRFIHEPIALLISTIYLAQKHPQTELSWKLNSTDFLVCDWGAGTVDVALVQVNKNGKTHEFSCLGQLTDKDFGGTSIAKNAVLAYQKKSNETLDIDKTAYHLQEKWQGEELTSWNFNEYETFVTECRQSAANVISEKVKLLLNDKKIKNSSSIRCILHGGPLESEELRSFLQKSLMQNLDFSTEQFIHIGNEFAKNLPYEKTPWRRDVLVSTGAALFASLGKTLPEYEYEIALKDSTGKTYSSVFLATGLNRFGKHPITPPFTDCDYSVYVYQVKISDRSRTSLNKELHLYIREGAGVLYQIVNADAGYAEIQATESDMTGISAKPFADAKHDRAIFPECSTRFSIDF